jgi:hypothetical protein
MQWHHLLAVLWRPGLATLLRELHMASAVVDLDAAVHVHKHTV